MKGKNYNDIVELIGHEKAYLLFEAVGGCNIFIHTDPERVDNLLSALLDRQDIKKMCDMLGGTYLLIPKNDSHKREVRNRKIKLLKASGASLNELSIAFGLTARQIITICRK